MAPDFRRLTPPGAAPVAVVRLHGDLSPLPLLDPRGLPCSWPEPGAFRLVRLASGSASAGGAPGREATDRVDEALAVGLADGGELHVHGGPGQWLRISRWLFDHGCRESTGGRAGGGAVAVPSCWRAVRAALSCRDGPLAGLVGRLAAGNSIGAADRALVRRVLDLRPFAEALRIPPVVSIIGRPNVGKSTLFNAWVGHDRALVSPLAGTTRDPVEALVAIRGVPVRLQDTAGIDSGGDGPDGVDHDEGPEQSARRGRGPGSRESVDGGGGVLRVRLLASADEPARRGPRTLVVVGRADLLSEAPGEGSRSVAAERPSRLAVSGRTGAGLAELVAAVGDRLGLPAAGEADPWTPWDPDVAERIERALAVADGG